MIDTAVADALREEWTRAGMDVVLDFIDCPDRRIARAAAELASAEAAQPGVQVTVVLPRRSYSPLIGRLLHDRTADKIAAVVSRIPHAAATIVPFDVQSRLEVLHARHLAQAERAAEAQDAPPGPGGGGGQGGTGRGRGRTPRRTRTRRPRGGAPRAGTAGRTAAGGQAGPGGTARRPRHRARRGRRGRDGPRRRGCRRPVGRAAACHRRAAGLRRMLRGRRRGADRPPPGPPARDNPDYDRPAPPAGVNPIGSLARPGRATVEGRVRAVEIRPVERNSVLAVDVADSTGYLTALFYGRSHIPGIVCGARVRFRGPVGLREDGPVMINPAYELLFPGTTRGTLRGRLFR